MNLRDLQYLVALADLRHFGKAAQACFVSQPTLSMQVKKLEAFLGVALLERNARQVLLTPTGDRVVEQARRVLREADALRRIAQQARDPFSGELRLGIIPTIAPYLLPDALPKLRRAVPDIQLQLIEAQTSTLARLLGTGEIEAVIGALPFDVERTVQHVLYVEPFLLAVAKDHALARRKFVTLSDLDGEQVMLLEDGHCLRDQALAICSSSGAVENANFRATSIETLRHMVAANSGVTLMPERAVSGTSVRYIPFQEVRGARSTSADARNAAMPHRIVGMVWRESSPRGAVLEKMAEALSFAS